MLLQTLSSFFSKKSKSNLTDSHSVMETQRTNASSGTNNKNIPEQDDPLFEQLKREAAEVVRYDPLRMTFCSNFKKLFICLHSFTHILCPSPLDHLSISLQTRTHPHPPPHPHRPSHSHTLHLLQRSHLTHPHPSSCHQLWLSKFNLSHLPPNHPIAMYGIIRIGIGTHHVPCCERGCIVCLEEGSGV